MALEIARRRLLQLAALVTASAGLPALDPAAAYAADAFDVLRATWVELLTGGAIDATDADYADALATLVGQASSYQSTMSPNSTAVSLWPSLPLSDSANMTASYKQLATMATAYATPGSLYQDAGLGAAVATGLDFLAAEVYTATATESGNWWDWEIGSPKALLNAALAIYPLLDSTQIASYTAAIDNFVPDPTMEKTGTSRTASTGANRVDLCQVVALRGVLGKNGDSIAAAASGLADVFPYVTTADGLYADGSFVQHTRIAYTGTYGMVLLLDLAGLFQLLAGSTWAITDPNAANIYDAVDSAFAPWVWNGLCLDAVRGRAVSRVLETDLTDGGLIIQAVLQLALSASAAQAADFQTRAKGWITADNTYAPYYATAAVPAIANAKPVMAASAIPVGTEPDGLVLFPGMDRAVHRRPGWAFALAMSSTRIGRFESINGENLHGWHTGDGMGYVYLEADLTHFTDSYWPTVDPYRMPGTTVDTMTLADSAGTGYVSSTSFAGGAAVSTGFGCVGMDFRQYGSTLAAKKSWFLLDDCVFALGAGITGGSGADVVTMVENRNLHAGGTNALTVDGTAQSTASGWSASLAVAGWAQLDQVGGYLFPGGATVQAARTDRTGAWSDINTGGPTDEITRTFLTLALDHGTAPSKATYVYALLPGFTTAQTAARAAQPTVFVLSNTATVQAVTCPKLGLTAANFFAAGTAGVITASAPCSVVLRQTGGRLELAVSDPTQTGTSVTVQIAGGGSVLSADSTVTAGASSTALTATVALTGTAGVTEHAAYSVTTTDLPPVADAYTRDGTYASVNYGTASTLVVKNTGTTSSGYSRCSYLSFDTTALTGATITAATLMVYGYVSDSGGTSTTLTAYEVDDATWTESGITWSTQPALGRALGTATATTTKAWLALDVTAYLTAATPGRITLGLYQPTAGLAVILNSREASANAPYVMVTTA
ncbi:polysaccharide lyase 8 family protein [Actinospica sp. MGRD01-02]|uniref:Polysaccharide lyase 8 family protein n=1 Tax=Actinospica acidithermotolerans TaxID=2828514 RepID=A0A941EGS4_9ACTN|nr:polysaccharide lyase family 8 super-sandwich domain-containing protein [Actinospica acidithermotolerans]MBR7831006.1 polysaccharide lyase 8 family protein [Actinospica acidithermotolerans]